MDRRRLLAILACLSLTLAGCTAPVVPADERAGPGESEVSADEQTAGDEATSDDEAADDEATSDDEAADDETDEEQSAAEDGSSDRQLPVEEDVVWNRVQTMMDTEAAQPSLTVGIPGRTADAAFARERSRFKQALNATASGDRTGGTGPSGVATPMGVYVEPGDGPPSVVEQVVAHEYAHSVQYSESMFDHWLREPVESTDHELVQTALIEGGATYIGDEYTARHLGDVPLQSTQMKRSYQRAPAGDRFAYAPYYFGAEYAHEQVSSPADLETIYLDPPYNTAQLLHGEDAGEEMALSVSVDDGGRWEETSRDTKGELFTRVALMASLSNETAAAAAEGWGNDSAVAFDDDVDDPSAFVWTLRFRTAADAEEFADAVETSLDRRTDSWADRTDAERIGDRTVALTMGPDAFRDDVTVVASGGDVRIGVGAGLASPQLGGVHAPASASPPVRAPPN